MLMVQLNPFIIEGYLSPEYFCDRVEETTLLTRHLTNRCNVALIAPKRLGKSGLIYNCFQQENIRSSIIASILIFMIRRILTNSSMRWARES